jgi:hypothetical protein
MKVSMEIDNNFGYEKITQLVLRVDQKKWSVFKTEKQKKKMK